MDKTHFKSIFGGSVGNLIEWYDWYAYSVFALYFAGSFFPEGDQTAQLLNTAGIFAIGFLMRPIGGWVMGIFRSEREESRAYIVGVDDEPGFSYDRVNADLRGYWYRGTGFVGVRSHDTRIKYRGRIWRGSDVFERDCTAWEKRYLLEFSVRKYYDGATSGAFNIASPPEMVAD
jgi:hypothetical protein